jgi:hypothetical protein
MEYFVNEDSIVRKIWGRGDTILFIFAGASAEFALNKAVDWLYFTGKLPSDPLGRLFSTVSYARSIVFAKKNEAEKSIDIITAIHGSVEAKRGMKIPDWAYRDVLFMLIDYSIRSFEVLERKLTVKEKEEVFNVFNRVGIRMGLSGLPETYEDWIPMRAGHLREDMKHGALTDDLFGKYRQHLGYTRYILLLLVQALVCPVRVRTMLRLRGGSLLKPVIVFYKLGRIVKFDRFLKNLMLPSQYKKEIMALDVAILP